jgi:hypothetical protein
VRAPELHESSSSYEDETDPSNEYDGKLFADRVVQKPTIAAAIEALGDDDDVIMITQIRKKQVTPMKNKMTLQLQQPTKRLL